MYSLIKPFLFRMDAEKAHHAALSLLKHFSWLTPRRHFDQPVEVAGLRFNNPVGLAAGLDKNGDYIQVLAKLGFGFMEVGTATPRPQEGNAKPRLFRLKEDEAIINRMGFNNKGIDNLIENVIKSRYHGVLGINIGKNADTPMDQAVEDYIICLRKAYDHASYITANISSPNTKNLRELQNDAFLDDFLCRLMKERDHLKMDGMRHVPLFVKVAPDLDEAQIETISNLLVKHRVDGLIATNTLVNKPELTSAHQHQQGGLSGKPIFDQSHHVVSRFHHYLQGRLPIIAVGGINSRDRYDAMLAAGASAVQVYSGLIYDAGLVKRLLAQK